MKVIVWAEHVARNHAGVQSAVLVVISSICDIYQPFGVTVTVIRGVRRSIMDLYTKIPVVIIIVAIYYTSSCIRITCPLPSFRRSDKSSCREIYKWRGTKLFL